TVNKGISVASSETGTFRVPTGVDSTWNGSYGGRDFNANTGATLIFDIDGSFNTTRFLRGESYTKTGTGTLTLNQTNSFGGTLNVSEGTVIVANSTAGGNASGIGGGSASIVIEADGSLVINGERGTGYHGGSATINGGTLTLNGGDLSFVNGNTLTFAVAPGTIDGTGYWRRREGGNKVAVTGAASGSTISVATLNLLDSNPVFEVFDGANAADLTISSAIEGSSNLVKTGDGTLVISGVSTTYSGTTQVNGGILQVTGSLSGNMSVGSSGTLAGNGTIGGNTSVFGTLAPGNSPGTLSITGNLSLDASAALAYEINGGDTTVGSGVNDLSIVSGDLTLAGTLNITGSGSFAGLTEGTSWRLIDYTGSLTDNGLTLGSTPTLDAGSYWHIDTSTPNQVNLSVIPEPSTAGLALLALAAGAIRRRR
ncbi:MAG: autotransporter-associated beta strand repeat-containing protein, partial [Luteolibacter sp.]